MEKESRQLEEPKQQFKRIGCTLFLTLVIKEGIYFLWAIWMTLFAPRSNYLELVLEIISYGLALLFFLWQMKKIPDAPKDSPKKLSLKEMGGLFFISMSGVYLFNHFNGIFTRLIYFITSIRSGQEAGVYISLGKTLKNFPSILFLSVLVPIVLEIIFRGVLIDKLRGYGERRVIVFTAFTFMLFQGDLSQLMSTFFLGLIYGYVAFRTGTIRYTTILHVAQKLFVLLFIPALGFIQNEKGMILQLLIPLIVVVVGGFLFMKNIRKINLLPKMKEIDEKVSKKIVYGNRGMLLYYLTCIGTWIGQTLLALLEF